MNNKPIDVEIFLTNDESLQVSTPQMNQYEIWSLKVKKDNEKIQKFFDDMAKLKIIKCYEKDKNRILYIQNTKNTVYKVILKDYNKLLNAIRCNKLDKKMNAYWLKKAIKEIPKNLNIKLENLFEKVPTKYIVAGSLLTATIMIPSVVSANKKNEENTNSENNFPSITEEATLDDQSYETEEIIIDQDIFNTNIDKEKFDTNKIEILQIDEKDFLQNNDSEITTKNEFNFNDLAHYTTIDEYINFASNLYGVNIETAKYILSDKINNMEDYIKNSNNVELKNLYELKKLGIINGDLEVIGTFVIIKNYAIDNLNLTNQEPIISNKSEEDKEQDMINIARYIYGINNNDILNTMIAIHRLETGYGTSSYAQKLNNFGGNMNTNPSQEQIDKFIKIIQPETFNTDKTPIPNIYKTAEIGEESMVRNLLNVYSKCLHDEECLEKNNIVDFLSKKYCTHTPKEWAQTVKEMLNDGDVQETVETYINTQNKIR